MTDFRREVREIKQLEMLRILFVVRDYKQLCNIKVHGLLDNELENTFRILIINFDVL